MKRYIYLSILLAISFACQDDNDEPKSVLKNLKEPVIKVMQGENIIEDAVINGVINLEQGKAYRIELIFSETVQLAKGKFLKMKTKNKHEFYAEFYGRNLIPINEKVVFYKEGYANWSLQIKQDVVIPNYYVSVKPSKGTRDLIIKSDIAGKEVQLIDKSKYYSWYGDNYYKKDIDIIFPAPVIIDTVKDEKDKDINIILAERQEDGQKYKLTIITAGLKKSKNLNYKIVMPFYKNNNGKKGEKLGDIVFKGDNLPYPVGGGRYTSIEPITKSDLFIFKKGGGYEGNKINLGFEIQGVDSPVFITNINLDYFEGEAKIQDRGWYGKGWELIIKKEKIDELTKAPVHAFDVYEGISDGLKKEGVEKREIFMEIK